MRRSKMSKMSMARNRTKIQKKKIDKMEKSGEYLPHTHTGKCYRSDTLRDILMKDKMEEFMELYGLAKFKNALYLRCNVNSSKCSYLKSSLCVLNYNLDNIARHVIKKEGINIYDLIVLIRRIKGKDADRAKKLFLESILYSNLTDNETSYILGKLFKLGDWDLIDLFHTFGSRIKDINTVAKYIPENKIQLLADLDYTFNFNSMTKFLMEGSISIDFANKYGLSKDNFVNEFTDKANVNQIIKMYGTSNIETIQFIEKSGFEPSEMCLDNAFDNHNFPVIFHLLKLNIGLSNTHLYKLFFVPLPKKREKKRRIYYGSRYRMRLQSQKYASNGNLMLKIDNYEENVIKILGMLDNKQNKLMEKIVSKSLPNLLHGKCFKLYAYLKENYVIGKDIKKGLLDNLLIKMIKDDDIESIKKLFEYKIVLPIDISTQPSYMDCALLSNSTKLIEYFDSHLKMICGQRVMAMRFKYKNVPHAISLIDNLHKMGFPFTKEIVNDTVINGNMNLVKKLLEIKAPVTESTLEYALANKEYDICDYLLNNTNVKLNKNKLIDRIFKKSAGKQRRGRYWYGYNNKIQTSITHLNFMIKKGYTASKVSSRILAETGLFSCVVHLHKKLGIKPDGESILKCLKRYRNRNTVSKTDIKALEYFSDVMGIDVFSGMTNDETNDMIERLMTSWDPNVELIKYVIGKSKMELNISHMHYAIGRRDSLEMLKLVESRGIVPTKDIMIESMSRHGKKISEYLHGKYKFDITLQDIHTLLASHWMSLESVMYVHGLYPVKFTPYTIEILTKKFMNKWSSEIIKYVIKEVGQMTQEIHDKIKDEKHLKNFLKNNKYEIVEYKPTDDEIIDMRIYEHHDDYTDSEDDLDFVEEVVGEKNVDDYINDIVNDDIDEVINDIV